jgi:hypothetical protein
MRFVDVVDDFTGYIRIPILEVGYSMLCTLDNIHTPFLVKNYPQRWKMIRNLVMYTGNVVLYKIISYIKPMQKMVNVGSRSYIGCQTFFIKKFTQKAEEKKM